MELIDDSHQQKRPAPFAEKEHMFDKMVTPSDVGKLNRLVIPKQHAERYFPLDACRNAKGLLLSFEDSTGKSWRFRYSYWGSSQSYVMTRGWSRFVKEKRLDAGDTVSFGRGVGEAGRDRLFIDWKRRPIAHGLPRLPRLTLPGHSHHHRQHEPTWMMPFAPSGAPWEYHFLPPPTSAPVSAGIVYDHGRRHLGHGYDAASTTLNPYLYLRSAERPPQMVQLGLGRGGGDGGDGEPRMPMVFDSGRVVEDHAMARKVRLFGVNLDCSTAEADHDRPGGGAVGHRHAPVPPPLQLSIGTSEMVRSPGKDDQSGSSTASIGPTGSDLM